MFGLLLFLVSVFHPAAAQAPVEQESAMEEGAEASSAAPAKPAKRAGKKRKPKQSKAQSKVKALSVSPAPKPAAPMVQEKKAEVKPESAKNNEPIVPATGITPSNP